jgi:MFS superfamily sulfate permease-like transporter
MMGIRARLARGNPAADFTASIVVFLVAMPLCMGIAVASGVPAEKGLITGIVGGLVVGLIAGSPLQVRRGLR